MRVPLDAVRKTIGPGIALQGNLDPCALHAPPEELREMVADVILRAGPIGHVFNLGHGILPGAPIEGVLEMIRTVRQVSTRVALESR